ncbi:hypothetical protein [Sulfurimonas sp.]|jgi:hypothetical protein|uniref:hypothetical protein n=1 Tax=Sulfurimonas sp. TaxID=2022749 RepID=UPI002A367B49|nr:hypothetical protein [Sulfurimonas sp.]MDY0122953.1 hypothetical protein [Sulfurimonas sp.]
MKAKRVYVENQKYKEFHEHCVGIDYVQWDDGSDGYIYFEESVGGNRAEAFYKTLEEALVEYDGADEFFQIGKFNEYD